MRFQPHLILFRRAWKLFALPVVLAGFVLAGQGCSMASAGTPPVSDSDSVVYYSKLAAELPHEPRVYYNRGIFYYRMEKYREAIADFSYALKVDSGFYPAWLTRGDCQRMLKNHDQAVRNYDNYYNSTGGSAYLFRQRAYCNFCMKKYPAAISDYNKLELLGEADGPMYAMRGRARTYTGELTYALGDLQEAVKLSPDSGMHYIWLGNVQYKLELYTDAINNYLLAMDKKADMNEQNYLKEAYVARASRSRSGGAPGEALVDLKACLKLDPEYGPAIYQRGLILYDLGNLDDACYDFKTAGMLGVLEAFDAINSCCPKNQ